MEVEVVGGSRNIHFLALSVSKGARPVIKPIFLETKIAVIQTIDFINTRKISLRIRLHTRGINAGEAGEGALCPYLHCKVEQVQVPVLARHAVLVDDGHGNRREAIGQDGYSRAILRLGQLVDEARRVGHPVRRGPGEEGVLFDILIAAFGHADRKVVALLVGSHVRCSLYVFDAQEVNAL